jgi:hypothetical protein
MSYNNCNDGYMLIVNILAGHVNYTIFICRSCHGPALYIEAIELSSASGPICMIAVRSFKGTELITNVTCGHATIYLYHTSNGIVIFNSG